MHLTGRNTVSWTVMSVVTRRGSTDTSRCLVGCSLYRYRGGHLGQGEVGTRASITM